MSDQASSGSSPPREQILDAAARLHAARGPGFTMDELEAGVAVSRASIYRHVGGKREVLRRLAAERGIAVDEDPDTRTRILSAARRVFTRRGPRQATIEAVAAEAGVGVATVYRHFGDKERLVLAFIDEMTPRALLRDAVLHPTADVAADLRHIVGVMTTAFAEHRDLLRRVYLGSDDERRYLDTLREPADSTFGQLEEWFRVQRDAGRLRTEAEPHELALALLGMVLGTAVIGPLHVATPIDPERAARVITDVLLTDLREGS